MMFLPEGQSADKIVEEAKQIYLDLLYVFYIQGIFTRVVIVVHESVIFTYF